MPSSSANTTTDLASVAAALGQWAARTPERTAYVFLAEGEEEQDRLTYAALDVRARAIAAALGRSVPPGERALLLYPPGLDFIAAFFGCLYAGLIAVPAYPPQSPRRVPRLLTLLADARPAVALTSKASLKRVRGWLETVPDAGALRWLATDELEPAPAGWEPFAPKQDDVAFLQYTSGSTSTPKGVVVSHGNLLHNQEMIRRAFGQDEDSVIVGWLPLYHDMGLIGNVLQPLYVGARCVLMSPHSFLQRPQRWLEAVSRYGATTSGGPNFAFDLCVRKVSKEDLARLDLHRWSVAFNGAEPVRPETMERFAETFAPAGFRREAFYPCYGLAEGTLFAAGGPRGRGPEIRAFEALALERNRAVPVADGAAPAHRLVGCGHAWMEQEIAVVDPETGERCAPGRVGEIWISGPSVARGYWGREEETRHVFAAGLPGSRRRFLRTGDLGVISEGELFVTGRLKDLIILRGRNLYPQDLELTAEASHPALRPGGSAAFSVELEREERAVLLCEVERRAPAPAAEVADAVRRAVAEEHEVQVHEVVLIPAGTLPKTSSGKVRRSACRSTYLQGELEVVFRSLSGGAEDGEEEPAGGLTRLRVSVLPAGERQAAVETWLRREAARACRVPLSEVRPDRPLTGLGLDSLAAVEIQQAADAALGVSLSLSDLLRGATPSELAAGLLSALEGPEDQERPTAGTEDGLSPFPLTYGQRALWFLDRLSPGSAAYNLAAAARVRGVLDPEALRRALADLAGRHAALRGTFEEVAGQPRQRALAGNVPRLTMEDAASWSEERTRERLDAEARRPFDLAGEPPFRVLLLVHAPESSSLLLVLHHLVCDFWSLVVILSDLEAFYRARTGAAAVPPSPSPAPYAQYVRWQEQLLASSRGAELLAYWERQLAGPLPPLELPTDRPRPAAQTYRGLSVPWHLEPEDASRLGRLCAEEGATPFMGLLAGLQILLHRLSGQREILVGTPTSGRSAAAWKDTVGYFVNPVVLRADLEGDPGFSGFLARLRPTVLAAFEHQDLPFALLAERLQPERDASRPPLFQALLILQKAQRPELLGLAGFALGEGGDRIAWAGLDLEALRLGWRPAPFDLTLSIAARGEGLAGSLQLNADLFEAATAERLAGHLTNLLRSAVADPRLPIGELPLLSAAEAGQILHEWNATRAEMPEDVWIHRAVESQAQATPEAVAVLCEEESATYRELNERANRLAHHLQAMGIEPEARVGVCLNRSVDMVVSLLGILKAGGAYVPLDPAYPRERLGFILEDAGVEVLVTRETWGRRFFSSGVRPLLLDAERAAIDARSAADLPAPERPDGLAYLIYTSGSTGTPKGVMVSHRNVANFFLGMDRVLGTGPGCWLAVTSLSFDISVLELLWTLSRGFQVVVQPTAEVRPLPAAATSGRGVDFSLFYFASDEGLPGGPKYRLLLEGAKFADRNGFAAVWTPERHFHAFGGLYPNPAVTGAAVAAVTERVGIRAGSVVLPLHHPLRVAEEWAVVDNLSGGRVGISFASGWNAADFVFAPERFSTRKDLLRQQIDVVRRLWRGEAVCLEGGAGEVEVRTLPRPVQPELPFWLTAAASPETFRLAGEMGASLLTHLLGQTLRDLAARIALYRQAWKEAGHPGQGHVTLMLHTFVGDDAEGVREVVREPFTSYLASSLDLMKALAPGEDLEVLTEEDRRGLLARAFNRYFETSGLFGTPEACLRRAGELRQAGVDEIACLIDFGVAPEVVLQSLGRLAEVCEASRPARVPAPRARLETLPALIARHGVTHLQCTPSAALALLADPAAPAVLGRLERMMVGGEALPPALAERLSACLRGELLNMYGPTETTIWSAVGRVESGGPVTLGRPIANTEIRIVDERLQPVPVGRPGELLLSGEGVVRGYWQRPELTAERFFPDPWSGRSGGRLYRTGDRARWRPEGRPDFLGRLDHQVKVRGHRIEPGEIEATLARHPAVREGVVILREDSPGDQRLVAYLVAAGAPLAVAAVRDWVQERLPQFLWPSAYVVLEALPLTPNGKLDRGALARFERPDEPAGAAQPEAPQSPVEELVAGLWASVLGRERVGLHDDFFALGGHSLLATQVVSRVRDVFGVDLPLRTLFERTTVAALSAAVEEVRRGNAATVAIPLVPVPRRGDLPLSFAQERLWFLDQLEPSSAAYNDSAAFSLGGPLEVRSFEAAFGEMVRRHEVLRTTFAAAGGRPVQRIAAPTPLPVPVVDLTGLAGTARQEEVDRLLASEVRRPFDLARGPLVRLALLRREPGEHLALLVLHHIISDGWSMGVLARELTALYAAFAAGEPSPLPELPVQYADYAVWQRAWLEAGALESQLAWWRRELAADPGSLELPSDRPRPAVPSHRGGQVAFALPAPLTAGLEALSRRSGVTLFMTLLAGWSALLARYSSQEDVRVGSPIANRTRLETEGLIGCFVNTLVLRTDLSGDPELGVLLERVRRATLGAYEHQDVPFERLVEELQPERHFAHSPLFQVLLVLQNAPLELPELPGLTLTPVPTPPVGAKFDLSLVIEPQGEGLAGTLEYSGDLFDPATVARLGGHLETLLAGAVAAPERRISELPLLPAAECEAVLRQGRGDTDPRRTEPCHRLFEERAASLPDAVAIEGADGRSWTYSELDSRSTSLARRLRRLGIGPEVPTAVLLPRSPELVAAMLAVWKAGGVYLPIDPGQPEERLAYILEDSGAALVLTLERLAKRVPGARVLSLDTPGVFAEEQIAGEELPPVWPESLAYVIFTSGSTGRPKGVAVAHGPASEHFQSVAAMRGLGPGDRILLFASPGFDVSLEDMVPALIAGATLVERGELWEPGQFLERATALGLCIADLPTAYWQQWVRGSALLPSGMDATRLRQVFISGEGLPAEAARLWWKTPLAGIPLINAYGPTEAVITATALEVGCVAAERSTAFVPIGRPYPGREARALDRAGHLLPWGIPGELCLGSRLARGYLGQPDRTAERFVPDPFGEPGSRLYRTGDRVRLAPDGTIEFLGRLDHQVKIRGFRIEPAEIEAALARLPGVRQAAVLAQAGPVGSQLVAWIVPLDGEAPNPAGLRAALARELPDYMIPAVFSLTEALPLTPSGKVDRVALARFERPDEPAGAAEPAAPQSPAQELVASLWASVLGRERVGPHDDFFALGGHSLLATQVVSRLRDIFGIDLPLRVLFERTTVAALATAVEEIRRGAAAQAAPPLVPVPQQGDLPLSFAQERLWFLDQLEPGSAAYNISAAFSLCGPLEVRSFAAAFGEIVRRHEALRTTFAEAGGRPVQRVAAPAPLPVPVVDLTGLEGAARQAEVTRLLAGEVRSPFDLARGPLVRLTLLYSEPGEHLLLLGMHHIVSDGWSMGVLASELTALYAAFTAGEPSPLPELPVQYADYAVWQRAWLEAGTLESQLAWWRHELAAAPGSLELPFDRPRPTVPGRRGGQVTFALPARLAAGLEALSRRSGTTLFMTLLAGWSALLARYSEQEDVLVGSPIANRTLLETEGLIGFFANTLVLRTDLSGDPELRTLLERVRRATLGAYEHQDVPFERLVEELQPERHLAQSPLFQVLLTVQNDPLPLPELSDLTFTPVPLPAGDSKFDLSLTLEALERTDTLQGSLVFSTDLFDAATAARLAGHFVTLLTGVEATPETRISALPLLSTAERSQLQGGWNDTRLPLAWGGGLHRLFAEQARRTPAATALVWEPEEEAAEEITFRELESRANQLARHLQALGVGPDIPVGLLTERSPEMVVGLLGILKAGGAYLPLDPRQPESRLAFVVRDAGAPVLVTQGRPEGLPGTAARVVRLDADRDRIAERSPADLGVEVGPDHLAYVIYTSGTTGAPKGAMIRHASVENLLAALERAVYADDARPLRVSVNAPLAFDASVKQWVQLLHGHALVLIPEELRADGAALLEFLTRNRVDVLDCTPPQLRLLLDSGFGSRPGGPRRVLVGGEAVSDELWRRLTASDLAVYNVYGPTECTVDTLACRITAEPPGPVLGGPIANVGVHVLDPHKRLAPAGVPGELCIAGAGLARGYLGRPDLTAEKFIPDPFAAEPGARLYRSGDRARRLADGRVEFLGRVDHQVKIRGFRVETGEVESVLAAHPDVREVAVVVREEGGERSLAACVAPAAKAPLPAELRAFLRERLPEPMIPAAYVLLERLPLTPNGKVDRRALARIAKEAGPAAGAAPAGVLSTPAEEVVAGIFAELGLPGAGAETDFFALGGHSLLAIRLVSRVRALFGVDLPVRAVFELRTVEGLAARIEESAGSRLALPPLGPRPAGGEERLPLSFAQERLWFLEQLAPGTAAYNVPILLDLEGELDPAALAAALDEILRRHEVLRTAFPASGGEPVQAVRPFRPQSLPLADLAGLPEPARHAEAGRLTAAEARRPFALETDLPLRASLLCLGPAEHTLVVCVHHIAFDGWSTGVLMRELGALYDALAAGRSSPLPELPVQYADFALWQRRWLAGAVLEAQLAWWRERLGTPEPLPLPADRPRTAAPESRGSVAGLELPRGLGRDLAALGRREGATLFMTLLAVFQALLARYSGRDDVTVGSPVANRNLPEVEGLVGFFVNTLALRTDLSGDPGFLELLARVRETALGAYAHQDAPFEKVVEAVQPRRAAAAGPPLVESVLALERQRTEGLHLPGLCAALREIHTGTAKFPLLLAVRESEGELQAVLEFADRFDAATADRLLGHLATLLAGAAARPESRLSDLPLLTAAERDQLRAKALGSRADYPRETPIHRLFEEQAVTHPGQTALVADDGESLTYAALNARANRLARHLRAQGVGPESLVGVLLDRSVDMIVSYLGVLKAGGAYVPLDPSWPSERLARLAEEVPLGLVLTRESLGREAAEIARRSAENLEGDLPATGLAYALFTSGSTGRPKAVGVEHRAVVRLVRGADYAAFGPDEVFLHLAHPAFDASTLEIWGPLLNGGRLALFPPGPLSLEALEEALRRHGVTTLWLTAGLFHQVVESRIGSLRGLSQLAAGGDVLSPEAVNRVLAELPGLRLINGYGPTENTTFTCCHTVVRPVPPGASVAIGRPIANTRVYLLDRSLCPVPVGVPGEIYAGGDGLARGYLGRPEQTAERFLPDPFAAETGDPGGRLYRTGDLARLRADGDLEFLGRTDQQVKIRGFRVEPGEVEAVLVRQARVREAVVLAREIAGSRALVAYLVVEGSPIPTGELRELLRRHLPEPLVPAAFVFLPELPLTPNGKVDRRALPDPEREPAADALSAPRTPAEELLAGLWSEVLGLKQVGSHESFFDLGGHSLLATRVVSRLRDVFGVELPLRTLFDRPSVAELAPAIEEARRGGAVAEAPPVVPVARDGNLPLSFAQQRLWLLDRLEPKSPVYNVPAVVLLEGDLEVEALRRSLEIVAARHEGLRTTFREKDGQPVQVVAPALPVLLPVVDLAGLPREEKSQEALRLAADEALSPFDLEAGPLFRATLVRSGRDEHRLLLTLHHIVSDGWSMGVLVREVQALYRSAVLGERADLPALPVQYADYAMWQRSWLTGEALASRLSWWRERLQGAPAALDLPTDRPRPAVADRRGAGSSRALPQRLWSGVESLARRAGATPFLVVLAALQALLARYTGADDLTVGTPVAGRTRREIEDLIGLFVNTLVLRAELAGDPSFEDLLGRARESMLGAHAHQDLPFERLVEELAPERETGRTPLFQVMLAFGNLPVPPLELPGLWLSLVENEARTAKFDLTVSVAPRREGTVLHLLYRTDLFERTTAERMADHLTVLLAGAVADPAAQLSDLQLLTAAEREQLAREAAETRRSAPEAASTVPEIFRDVTARVPEAVAVADAGLSVTFRELAARSARLAGRLRRLGAGPEVPVALCAEPSSSLVAGLLAILQAGGVWVPLDPSHPEERLASMLEDSGAPLLVVEEKLAGRFAGARAHRVLLDSPEAASPPLRELPAIPSEGAAYVIYTSGSTGRPKGTVICHRSLAGYLAWFNERFARAGALPLPAIASPGFDASLKQLLAPLLRGDSVWIVPPGTASRPDDLLAELARHGAAALNCVPSLWRALLDRIESDPGAGRSLGRLLLGGEALDAGLLARTLRALPGIEIWNLYGPTEATANASCARVLPERIDIGRAVAGAALHVVDAHLKLLPVGVPGELAIAGPGLARGYLGLPALTAERFVPNPFATAPGERLYRTGDRARRRPGMEVELLGRLDRQVKVRGFRVEPGEVDAVLALHPRVKEAAVIGVPHGPGETRLVAYLAVDRSLPPEPEDVRRFAAERLPAPMVPTAWVLLDRLPRTPAGKLDARALPEPEPQAGGGRGPAALQNPAEELVAAIFADLLGVERVEAGDGFFELGGHSLLATQAVSRLRGAFGVELPLRALFDRPRVAELAEALEEARRGRPGRAAPPLVPVARGGDLPLSFAQERLWFLDQLEPGNTAYNVPAAFTLSGSLDVPALAAAYGGILRRHEALRTTFAAVDGRPVQRISPPGALPVPVVDLAGLPPADRQAEAARLAAEDARREFDLARGPLVRLTLLRLGREEHLAALGMHHIVSDAWSTRVLVRELTSLYTAFVLGTEPSLPELPVQYADYAVWQRAWLRGDVLEAELAFWREALAGAPGVLELPADRPRPPVPSGRGGSRTARLSPALTSALTALSRREGLTPFMTLLAAWSTLLFRMSEQTDFVVGVPIANRNRLETEGQIGFFTNTLALRARPAAEASFLGLASAVRETALAAYSHQDLPFERLVEELAPERSLAHTPLFQVLFSLNDLPAGELALPGLTLEPARLAQQTAKFDLSLFLTRAGGELSATLELSADLFEEATAERLLERFRTLLEGAVADPDRSLAELPLLPASERHQLLCEWNEAPAGESLPCVHCLVAAQVRRTPEATAVLAADGTELSYGELDRLADRLAHRLRELGVRPDDRVGVYLERSWEGVVALLAILRAGGCYLPLDPAYPRERLGFMLADAEAPVIVTRDRLAAALPPHGATVLSLDRGWPETAREGELPEVGPDHLAYAIYTSGSTGRPKGVALPHRTLANLIAWQIGSSAVPAGRTLQLASPSFDVSLQETLATWAAGGTLVLLVEEARGDAEALLCRLAEARVERLFLPFVALQQLAEAAASAPGALPPLTEVLTAGEQLQVTAEVRALFARLPGCALRNQYGPSEAHVVTELALGNERPGVVEEWPALPAIGRPIAGTSVHLLDPRGTLVPVGVPGEICLGGAGLARGYLGRPDQTAERFVPDPWGWGERLYRTGDLGRRNAAGDIEFLGRIDHQVKIRGFRIELGEIEAALAAHPAVREAVVVARGDGAGRRLVAYVLPATPGDLPGERLRAHLRESLPDYMVPAAFVPVAGLPLTPSGKVDRKALAASGPEPREAAAPDDAPRTPTEELLAGLWAEVLGLARVGIHEGFFDLGGHSLLATRLVARLRSAFGVELPLRALFERPSVAELAELLDSLTRESHGLATPPLERLSGSAEPPLSFAQQSLWLIDRIEGGSSTYGMAATLELSGRLDVAALAGSFVDVVKRHAILRTSFSLRGGEPRQVIHPRLEVPLLLADLSGLPASRWEEAREAVHRQLRRPFDLAQAPLLRTALLRQASDLHVLELCQHHIISDAWSIGILVRELAAGYTARARGERAALPPLPIQYADYAAWQRSWLRGEALERLLAFWHRQLGTDPPAAQPPTLRPAPAVRTRRGRRRIFPLSAALEPALRALARCEGVTLFMLLLGAFQALLHRATGQEDLVVVAAASRRDRLETEGLIGCFLNMLPLRVSLTGGLSFRRLLHRVREASLDAFAHQDLPFERLVTELRLRSENGRSPFQVAFGVQSAPPPLPELPELAIRLLDSESGTARLDLTLWVSEGPEGLSAAWTYSSDLFDGQDMERLHGLYTALLTAAATNPDAPLRDLAPTVGAERESGSTPRRHWEDLKKQKLHEARRRSVSG